MWKTLCVWCGLHLILVSRVEGVTLTIDPVSASNTVTLYKAPTSIADQSRIFNCGNIQAADIKAATWLSITRMTKREMNSGATTPVTIAIVLQDQGAERTDVVDIQDRNRVPDEQGVEGSIVKPDYRQSFLRIKFNTVAMKCDDAGQYFCEFNYLDTAFGSRKETNSVNLTVSAIPDRVSLIGQPENRRNGDGSDNYPFQMNVGDVIEFTCSGRIGGDRNAQWEWKKTGDTTGDLIKLVPSSMMYQNRVNETQGPAIPVEAECTNTRTTTLRYTISDNDKYTKANKIQFQCFTESGGANVSSRFVYIQVEGGGGTNNDGDTGGSADPGASNAGMIAGVVVAAIVFIVIVVLLVYFLWYRRRGGGDTYKTREETDGSNPNLAPNAADLYAQPHKDRNKYGHENRGMEERDQNNYNKKGRHRDDDYENHRDRGRHNYAMDDDFESRDGGSGGHPNDAPIGTGV